MMERSDKWEFPGVVIETDHLVTESEAVNEIKAGFGLITVKGPGRPLNVTKRQVLTQPREFDV